MREADKVQDVKKKAKWMVLKGRISAGELFPFTPRRQVSCNLEVSLDCGMKMCVGRKTWVQRKGWILM